MFTYSKRDAVDEILVMVEGLTQNATEIQAEAMGMMRALMSIGVGNRVYSHHEPLQDAFARGLMRARHILEAATGDGLGGNV